MIRDDIEQTVGYAMSAVVIGALSYVIYYLLEAVTYPIVV